MLNDIENRLKIHVNEGLFDNFPGSPLYEINSNGPEILENFKNKINSKIKKNYNKFCKCERLNQNKRKEMMKIISWIIFVDTYDDIIFKYQQILKKQMKSVKKKIDIIDLNSFDGYQ